MKNDQKGFATALLIAIIAVLVIGGGIYVYESKKAEVPVATDTATQTSNQISQTNSQNASGNQSTTAAWVTGDFMDYPADVSFTPAVDGSWSGPTFTFPKSYFSGSSISAAQVTSSASCGNDMPASNVTIEGLNFYKSANGLTYNLAGACNETFQLTISTGASTDMNSSAYQNLVSIFAKMIDSYAKKSQTKNVKTSSTSNAQQYTDSSFGFSFWYPNGWTVSASTNANTSIFSGGKIMNVLAIGSGDNTINIYEVYAANGITIPGHLDSPTYYFNASTHTWMTYSSNYPNPQPANVSSNTMGGLHMLWTGAVFYPTVIPLSAVDFLVIGDPQAGIGRTDPFAKTITATDPSVATPVSQAQQTQIIQAETNAYTNISGTSQNSSLPVQNVISASLDTTSRAGIPITEAVTISRSTQTYTPLGTFDLESQGGASTLHSLSFVVNTGATSPTDAVLSSLFSEITMVDQNGQIYQGALSLGGCVSKQCGPSGGSPVVVFSNLNIPLPANTVVAVNLRATIPPDTNASFNNQLMQLSLPGSEAMVSAADANGVPARPGFTNVIGNQITLHDSVGSGVAAYDDNAPNDGHGMGFAFTYPSTWTLTKNGMTITLSNIDQYGDTITITKVPGNTITTSGAQHGTVTYTYQNGQVTTTGSTGGTLLAQESEPGTAVPLFTIANGWPVFEGTQSVENYVVYIYGSGFLNINHSAISSTSDAALTSFIKSIVFTSNPSNPNM